MAVKEKQSMCAGHAMPHVFVEHLCGPLEAEIISCTILYG
jgi:hypothetical protein